MGLMERALWYVEWKLATTFDLDSVANYCSVSRFHLSRVFGGCTGHSVMNYARARRLSIAAQALVRRSDSILNVALEAGYGSHEAFTRAFRTQFGITPQALRMSGDLLPLSLMEPILMDNSLIVDLAAPRFTERASFVATGFSARYTFDTNQGIPAQWQKFGVHIGHVPGQVGQVAYGVCSNADENGEFDYICGVETDPGSDLLPEMIRFTVPTQRYAIFTHSRRTGTQRQYGQRLGHAPRRGADYECRIRRAPFRVQPLKNR